MLDSADYLTNLQTMDGKADTILSIPSDLAAQVQAEAREEDRPALDVLRDAVSNYVESRRLQRQQRARTVFKTEELSADKVRAIATGRMDSRHDHLDAELG